MNAHRAIKWTVLALTTPLLLFLLLAIVVYLPPVQHWAQRKATHILSEKTGLNIRIGRVALAFPIDLAINDAVATQRGDTLLSADGLRLGIRFWPLLSGEVNIKGVELSRAKVDTKDFISDIRIDGIVGRFAIERPTTINLGTKTVDVARIALQKSDVHVQLNDTAPKDSTQSTPIDWKIAVKAVDVTSTTLSLRMPGDSMRIALGLEALEMEKAAFDLAAADYGLKRLLLKNATVQYDIPQADTISAGLDFNHIALNPINLLAESLSYRKGVMEGKVARLNAIERSGLRIERFMGEIRMDSVGLTVPSFDFATEASHLMAKVRLPWQSLKAGTLGHDMDVHIEGSLGKVDLITLAGDAGEAIKQYMPSKDLTIDVDVQGNMSTFCLNQCNIKMVGVMTATASGTILNITDETKRKGDITYRLLADNLDPIVHAFITDTVPVISIPRHVSLSGKLGVNGNVFSTNSGLRVSDGRLTLKGRYATTNAYQATITSEQFPLHLIMPRDSLSALTAQVEVKGRGFDPFSPRTQLEAHTYIKQFSYSKYPLDSLSLDASLKEGQVASTITSANRMLQAALSLNGSLSKEALAANITTNVENLALRYLTSPSDSVHLAAKLDFRGSFEDNGTNIRARGKINDICFNTPTRSMSAAHSLNFAFRTAPDTTMARIRAGDLSLRVRSHDALQKILNAIEHFTDTLRAQAALAQLDAHSLIDALPDMEFRFDMGKKNPARNFLAFKGIQVDSVHANINVNEQHGIRSDLRINALKTGSLLLEETTACIREAEEGLIFEAKAVNKNRKNPHRFVVTLDGSAQGTGGELCATFRDEHNAEGLNIGARCQTNPEGDIHIALTQKESIIAYRKFYVNEDNVVTLRANNQIDANLDLKADDETAFTLHTSDIDSTHNLHMELSHVNLGELSRIMPFMPQLSGLFYATLDGQWTGPMFSAQLRSDARDFAYEAAKMGDFGIDIDYLPTDSANVHSVEGFVRSGDKQVIKLEGSYYSEGKTDRIEADVDLLHTPAALMNGFMGSDGTMALDGYLNGCIKIDGPTNAFLVNGGLQTDSLHVISKAYGITLRVEDHEITIEDSKLLMASTKLFANDNNPLNISGGIDFSNLNLVTIDMSVKAKNFLLINSPRLKQSVVFGTARTDIDATIKGNTNLMMVRGSLKVLDNTNMTYIMKDSPLTVEDRLNGLVEFVDFSDTTSTSKKSMIQPGGVMASMNVNISPETKFHCELSADGNSYVDCIGGGSISMTYYPSGEISLNGGLTMNEGEMKYTLPFIPLKTFKISEGSFVRFNGDPMDPTLGITAKETTRVAVNDEGSANRMVTFNVGVAITQTLSNMGLEFLIDAPDDIGVQNDLAAMSKEERGKLAVSMLATGSYLATSNHSAFRASNALNAFLQSNIQNVAGGALRTLGLSVGVEGGVSSTGEEQTDYSFQFAQHLWNDRITFKIGGMVSTGANDENQNQSFIDNISLEYRLDNSSSRNLRIFYNNNNHDPFEGDYSSAGAGFVLTRKSSNFRNLLFFKPHKKPKAATKDEP